MQYVVRSFDLQCPIDYAEFFNRNIPQSCVTIITTGSSIRTDLFGLRPQDNDVVASAVNFINYASFFFTALAFLKLPSLLCGVSSGLCSATIAHRAFIDKYYEHLEALWIEYDTHFLNHEFIHNSGIASLSFNFRPVCP